MFIQIGNRIINTNNIVAVEYAVTEMDVSETRTRTVKRLSIFVTSTQSGDYGQVPARFNWYDGETTHEATALWEQLQHYLAPTVIQVA